VGVVLALLTTAAFAAPTLTVQPGWKIVGVAVATSSSRGVPPRTVARALDRARKKIARELPGIRWEIASRVREARYEDDGTGLVEAENPGFERLVARLAASDEELAAADIVFVYAPCPGSAYSGMADLRAHPDGKAPVWYSVVNTEQGPHLARRLKLPAAVASLVDREPVRSLALLATTVHEFGHFLAPGTPDVRAAGDLAGRIGNGADEPALHDRRCIMWAPEPRSLLSKALAFPRVLQYCDRCRKRIGCQP
jgi:hypothetical protein